jgi:hypothetical protein
MTATTCDIYYRGIHTLHVYRDINPSLYIIHNPTPKSVPISTSPSQQYSTSSLHSRKPWGLCPLERLSQDAVSHWAFWMRWVRSWGLWDGWQYWCLFLGLGAVGLQYGYFDYGGGCQKHEYIMPRREGRNIYPF